MLEKEIDLIDHPTLRLTVFDIVNDLYEQDTNLFTNYPASISGRYHPPDERGSGGLIRHIKKLVKMANDTAPHFGLNTEERDLLIAACVLHDLSNLTISHQSDDGIISRNHELYSKYHGLLSALRMYDYSAKPQLDIGMLSLFKMIQSHMGAWFEGEAQPTTKLEIIFSLLDFIGTRDYIRIDI